MGIVSRSSVSGYCQEVFSQSVLSGGLQSVGIVSRSSVSGYCQ